MSSAESVFADNPTTNAARWDGVQWTAYPDPVRPPETDEEPWSVALPEVRPAVHAVPLVIAIGVIVGIALAGVLIRA